MPYDVFVAELRCPTCQTVVPDAEIQTYIRNGSADGSSLSVGFVLDPPDLTTESLVDAGYALIQPPPSSGPIRLLDVWLCPTCEVGEKWAMVEIADREVRRIEAVKMDRATLESAHFIDETNADLLAEALLDGAPAGDASSVEVLRQRLP